MPVTRINKQACKRFAKIAMSGNLSKCIIVTLITIGLSLLANAALNFLIPGNIAVISADEIIINRPVLGMMLLAEVIISLLIFPITMGSYAFFMTAAKVLPVEIIDIFTWLGEPGRIVKAVTAYAWHLMLSLFWGVLFLALPLGAVFYLDRLTAGMSDSLVIFIGILLLVLLFAGAVLAQMRILSLTPALYTLADKPEQGVREAFQINSKRMKGRRWEFFVLHLSFIPWILTAFFTCGLSMVYVLPYMNLTVSEYTKRLNTADFDDR